MKNLIYIELIKIKFNSHITKQIHVHTRKQTHFAHIYFIMSE